MSGLMLTADVVYEPYPAKVIGSEPLRVVRLSSADSMAASWSAGGKVASPHNCWVELQQIATAPAPSGPVKDPRATERPFAGRRFAGYQSSSRKSLGYQASLSWKRNCR